MARPTLFTHRKFRTLARAMKSKPLAVGTLELLWAAANDAGDALIGTAADVEEIACWRGKAGTLASLLVETGFLDDTDRGLVVHDHEHHCPQYVRRRREREQERRTGDAPIASQKHVTDASVASQRLVIDAPMSSTPISHLPSPISQGGAVSLPPAPPPPLLTRVNPRIVNPGAVVECWDFTFSDLKAMAAPLWPDERERYDRLLAWLREVDAEVRAAGAVVGEAGAKFWPRRFREQFGGGSGFGSAAFDAEVQRLVAAKALR